MKSKINLLKCLGIILVIFCMALPSVLHAADYCASPPFIAGKIRPNLLLLIDNSSSMYDLDYIAGSPFIASGFSCTGGVSNTTESLCTDDTYTNSKICSLNVTACRQNSDCTAYGNTETCANDVCNMPVTTCASDSDCPLNGKCIDYYSGYFDPSTIYQYQASTYDAGSPQSNDYFSSVSSMPAACCFGGSGSNTPYVCVNYDSCASPTQVTNFYATGKFLNWLSASKFDIEKKVLTGGKYSTASNLLIGESRGCDGRRFVKLLKTSSSCTSDCTYQPIAFAVRGPKALDPDNVKAGVEGGLTRIEIYSPSSAALGNVGACQCAVANWNAGNYGQAQTQTTDCLGNNAKSNTLNHSLQSCWLLKSNINNCIASGNCSDGVIWQGVNLQDISNACENSYMGYCGGNNSATDNGSDVYCSGGTLLISGSPSSLPGVPGLQNDAAGDWICTSQANHTLVSTGYDVDGNNTIGYVGQCVSFRPKVGNCNSACAAGLRSASWNGECICWDDNCAKEEILHYCYGAEVAEVIDPSEGSSSSVGNMPSILVDSFTQTLGTLQGTFYARVFQPTAPTGVINTFSGQILFGAMTFNYNGSNSECNVSGSNISCVGYCSNNTAQQCRTSAQCSAGASCILDSKTDGGHIISYIDPDPGSHSSGFIQSIDNIQATSWTPFAEAFYTAIGYYAAVMVCSNNASQSCAKDSDCASGATCVYKNVCVNASSQTCSTDTDCPAPPAAGPRRCGHLSRDFRLQRGTCSVTTSRVCSSNSNCPSGETCNIDSTNKQTGDYNLGENPSQFKCQPNNILLISDGASTADLAPASSNLASLYKWSANTALDQVDTSVVAGQCPSFAGSRNLDDLAYLAKNWNIKNFSTGAKTPKACSASGSACVSNSDCPSDQTCVNSPQQASEYINTYVVYTGRLNDPATNQCNPKNLMNDTAAKGGSTAALTASNPAQLQTALTTAFEAIAGRAASGTAASVLASGEGSGANLVQAIFYPSRQFGADEITWTGRLQNFWYYVDPALGGSTIMEDTNTDRALELNADKQVVFVYSPITHDTTISSAPFGIGGVPTPATCPAGWTCGVSLDGVKSLWEAGGQLLRMAPADRTIYTNLDDSSTMTSFLASNAGSLQPLIDVPATDAPTLINYIRGTDGGTIGGFATRNRTVTFNGVTGTWKLGDIVNSTPKSLSWVPQNGYYTIYYDQTYQQFTSTAAYQSRGMVFTGANDGMLHAFRLGLLGIYNDINLKATLGKHCTTSTFKACSTDSDCSSGTCAADTDLGKEMWAFIPKNSLPYLKYLAAPDYCHLYYVDAQPFIFDASFTVDASVNAGNAACDAAHYWNCVKNPDGSGWRTVLIGSMRLGGACKKVGDPCQDCTKTPINDPSDATKGLGYSSYFALDITDPSVPKLLWEFSDPGLGFSTSGPAIVRVGTDTSVSPPSMLSSLKNGRWLAIFGSGPTGWISQNNNMANAAMHQSSTVDYFGGGNMPNNMKLYVVDVATGALLTTIDTGEQGAFAGSLASGQIDFDQNDISLPGNYQDDAVYFGYTKPKISDSYPYTWVCANAGSTNTLDIMSIGAQTANNVHKGRFIELLKFDTTNNFWTYQGAKIITSSKYNSGPATHTVTVDSNWPVPIDSTGVTCNNTNAAFRISDGWTSGGVKRLLTKQDIDPTKWAVSTVIDSSSLGRAVGPVTSAVKKIENYTDHTLRLYFGTGRYFFRLGDLLDDPSNFRALYGIKDPCFQSTTTTPFYAIDSSCTTLTSGNIAGNALKVSSIGEAATSAGIDLVSSPQGWWIPLDGCKDSAFNIVDCSSSAAIYKPERVVNDPLATTTGAIIFTTINPTSDPCQYGGSSNLWAVRYDTGGTLVGTGILKGKVIIQTSTGDIAQIDLSSAFTGDTAHGQRKAQISQAGLSGGTPSIVIPPMPINRILHIKKR